MRNWKEAEIGPDIPLRDALEVINRLGSQMVVVVDHKGRLLGTLSDGDARRALLRGLDLSAPVEQAMHRQPTTARQTDDRQARLAVMRRMGLHQLPIIDADGVVVGFETIDDFLAVPARDEWVVIMAGGLGTRLGELTKTTPKPMLKVGDKPLLETILRTFVDQGFRNFYFSVNYLSETIEAHFGDGERFGAQIRYIKESRRMGTAGSLTLLPELPAEPLIVANGDLLANIDYVHMLDTHVDSGVVGTMGVSEYEFIVPYGVVHEENGLIRRIEEKPLHKSLISAGVYVLSPQALDYVPKETFFDMPSLFEILISNNLKAATYKVHGYWLDIGHITDFQKANVDIGTVFQ
jgi:dTDP-glucose pyrophosphorylase